MTTRLPITLGRMVGVLTRVHNLATVSLARRAVVLVVVLGAVARGPDARAGMAVADARISSALADAAGDPGTHDLLAYSLHPGPPVTENAAVEAAMPPGAFPATSIRLFDRIEVGGLFTGFPALGRVYDPPYGFRDRPKPMGGPPTSFVSSASPTAVGPAIGAAFLLPLGEGLPTVVIANARAPGVGQQAAAEAIDPITLPAGMYDYAPVINEATLRLDGLPNEFAGVTFFARDSRFTDPLWALGIVATGTLTSAADLTIGFRSQPLLGLDDAAVAAQVRSAFVVAGGTATLTAHTIFSTTYVVTEAIQFAEGVNAGVESTPVPEPSALVLAAVGVVGLRGLAARGRR